MTTPRPLLVLVAFVLLGTGCASLTPPPERGSSLRYTPPVAEAPGGVRGASDERPHSLASPRSAPRTRQAVLGAVGEVKGSLNVLSGSLTRLAARRTGIGGVNGAFTRYVAHGTGQLQWMEGALGGATTLADVALELHEPDMEVALLRMSGPRLQAALSGALRMRRLVQAGVISASAASAAVRIHAGGAMMAQGDLPKGVRDALGDGPEVRGMHETGRAGAGMAESPKHHVLPQEHREWFEKRGFTGDMNIDQFCVRLERSQHEAIHGGGNWRQGRMWPGEWNHMLMEALLDAETKTGRMLTRSQVLKAVARELRRYNLPMDFTAWRGP